MTHFAGGVLLLLAGGWAGLSLCHQLSLRRRTVCLLGEGLRQLERELSLHLTPLPLLFQRETIPFSPLFAQCGTAVEEGSSFHFCWDRLVDSLPHIGGEERQLLRPLGAVLGQFEGETQSEALLRVAERLREREDELRREEQRLGRVYPVVGLTAGAFLGIFLL